MLILRLKEPIKVSISLITFGQLISLIMTEDRIKKPIELSFFSAKFGALKKIHFSKSIVTTNSHRTLFMDRFNLFNDVSLLNDPSYVRYLLLSISLFSAFSFLYSVTRFG